MDHVSPFSKEIGDEWDRLVFHTEPFPAGDNPPPQEQVDGWKALYEKAAPGGQWIVSAPDAGLVASLGVSIAHREGRYADAVTICRHFLAHPDEVEDDHYGERCRMDLGLNLYLSGHQEEGSQVLSDLLKGGIPLGFRSYLYHIIEVSSTEEAAPDPIIADLVAEFLRTFNRHRSKARLSRSAKSNKALLSLLESTHDHHRAERIMARMRRKYPCDETPEPIASASE